MLQLQFHLDKILLGPRTEQGFLTDDTRPQLDRRIHLGSVEQQLNALFDLIRPEDDQR